MLRRRTPCDASSGDLPLPGDQRPENRPALVDGPRADADRLGDEPAVAIDDKDGGSVRDPVSPGDDTVGIEQDRSGDLAALHPGRKVVLVLPEVDREDREPLVLVLLVNLLDRRGQLPRAVRSAALPEVEKDGLAADRVERHRLALERVQRERRRLLVAERRELKRGEQTVERLVRRGGWRRRKAGREGGENEPVDQRPPAPHATRTRARGLSFTRRTLLR